MSMILFLLLSIIYLPSSQSLSATFSVNSYTRYTQFLAQMSKVQPDGCRTIHSSGGAAGGIVSEGQGYGVLMAGATAIAIGPSDPNFSSVVDTGYKIFLGWKRMCKGSTVGNSCQSTYYCSESGTNYPCLPHWKFNDQLGNWEYGSAPDGDEDAILGMILLVGVTDSNRLSWWSEVANWCYDSIIQFYVSEVLETNGNAVLKLGSCWGGMDCNNPSYHSPGAYRAMRNFLSKYGTALGRSSSQVSDYVTKYNNLITSSYKILLADQNQAGLTTNWYVPNSNIALTGSTGCSGSGTPADQYGAEAARGPWRVVIDWIWFPSEATQAVTYLDKLINQLATKYTGSSFNNLDTGGLVGSVFGDWLNNAFIYGPTFSTLVKPLSTFTNQQAALNTARDRINSASISDYYAGSWVVISTLTISGDFAKAAPYVGGSSSPPGPTPTPTKAPTAPTPTPTNPTPTPTKAPTPAPVPTNPTPTPTKAPTPAPGPTPTNPTPTPTKAPTAPTPTPTNPAPTPTKPTPTPTKYVQQCRIPGCTVGDKTIEFFAPSGVTVTKAEVICSDGRTLTCADQGSLKYRCTCDTACLNPVPQINGSPCPITLDSVSQSCGKNGASINAWWIEYNPPGSGWQTSLSSVKCSDGRFYACPNNFGSKVGCPIYDRECLSPTPIYNNSPCPIPAAILSDSVSSSESTLPAGAIAGICITVLLLFIVIIFLIIIKRKQLDREEIV